MLLAPIHRKRFQHTRQHHFFPLPPVKDRLHDCPREQSQAQYAGHVGRCNAFALCQLGNGRELTGSGTRVHIHLKHCENCQASHLFDNGIERLSPVIIGIVHHDVDEHRHQETKDLGTVPNLGSVHAAVPS